MMSQQNQLTKIENVPKITVSNCYRLVPIETVIENRNNFSKPVLTRYEWSTQVCLGNRMNV